MAKNRSLEDQLKEIDRLHQRGILTDEEHQARRAAVLSTTGTPASEGGSGAKGFFKFGLIGCLGVIGAFVALGIVVAIIAAAAGGGDDGSPGGQAGVVGTNKGDVHVALVAGSTGEIAPEGNGERRTRVIILQVVDNVESTNQFLQPADGKKWWGIEVEVQNVGTKEVTSLDWKLRTSDDFEHDRAVATGAPGEELEFFYNLTPGAKQRGWVYFEIDAKATAKWVRADPNPFLKNDLYFDAE